MSSGSNAQTFVVGEYVYSGDERGTVVSVDDADEVVSVEWMTPPGVIKYPFNATCLRKGFPWEK